MTDEEAIALALAEAEAAAGRARSRWAPSCWRRMAACWPGDGNRILENRDPTAHAEILAMRAAGARLGQ